MKTTGFPLGPEARYPNSLLTPQLGPQASRWAGHHPSSQSERGAPTKALVFLIPAPPRPGPSPPEGWGVWPGVLGLHCWALPSRSGEKLVSLAAPEGRALSCVWWWWWWWWWGMQRDVGWVGGDAARDMGFLGRWGWRKLGCGQWEMSCLLLPAQ